MTRVIMPIMGATLMSEIPFAMIAPHEAQAQRNHGQSLNRLAERGGLAVSEAIDIMRGKGWGDSKGLHRERAVSDQPGSQVAGSQPRHRRSHAAG